MPRVELVAAVNNMSGRNWTITKNIIDHAEPDCSVGRKPRPSECLPFRLLDDDQEVYFEGSMTPTQSEALFHPLDDFGIGYGCTEIQILENDQWTSV